YKREKSDKQVETLQVAEPDGRHRREVADGARRGEIFAQATWFARDLVNAPANDVNPTHLAKVAQDIAKAGGVKVEILDQADCRKLGVGTVVGVAAGRERRAMTGTTLEIGNTDAEGRLTLGDAICYAAQKLDAEEIVDLATLTGACVVALGPLVSGLFANNQGLADRLLAAAETAGERVWQLPLIDEYRENLKSDVADMNNVGPRGGGAITAGLFLKEFAG